MSLSINMTGLTGFVGITRSGKTKLMSYLFDKTGGLFIDYEDKGNVQAAETLTMTSTRNKIEQALRTHKKVRYVPNADPEIAKKEARVLVKILLALNISIHVYVDELQNYGGARTNIFDPLATQGLKSGVHLNWGTQRPAKASKTIASQTTTIVFFDMSSFEKKYFKEYDLPYDEIKAKMVGQPKHYFVAYTRGVGISEPYKVQLPQLSV